MVDQPYSLWCQIGAVGGPSFAVTTFGARTYAARQKTSPSASMCFLTHRSPWWSPDLLVRNSKLCRECKLAKIVLCGDVESPEDDCPSMSFEQRSQRSLVRKLFYCADSRTGHLSWCIDPWKWRCALEQWRRKFALEMCGQWLDIG